MKNLQNTSRWYLSILIVAILFLNACDKQVQEVQPAVVDDIIGTWTATEAIVVITYQGMSAYDYWISQGLTPEQATSEVDYQTRGFETYIPFSIEFKEDGTYNNLNGAVGDISGTPNSGTWELSEDRTILTIDGFETPVLSLSKNEFSYQIVFDSNEYSKDEPMTYDITLTYTKP